MVWQRQLPVVACCVRWRQLLPAHSPTLLFLDCDVRCSSAHPTWWVRQGSVQVYPCAKDRFDAIAETYEGLPQPSLQAFPGSGRFVCWFCRVRCVIMNHDNNIHITTFCHHLSHLLGRKSALAIAGTPGENVSTWLS